MTSSVTNPVKAFALIALGLAIAAMGIYVAHDNSTAHCPTGKVVYSMYLITT